ncbi:hypothetical protein G7072_17360 [Nocardioides sp. HDW12B]|uniref:HAAS signaling domain-containing protein n=1 Tax=Nocardioides sp. HDW12B TaxID=2714939 RepID=UPI0014099FD1|nr:hypothetical protein [Nocardioides sp. HDW12B]QIK67878.1 hypothetical protein G7072_17360 [Nocardioides sp. HDW12B]
MTQSPVTSHPLVARYLDDLARLLQGVDPVERTEVLDGVREHLETSLHGTDRSDHDVRTALDEVGPPQSVADEVYAGRPDRTAPRELGVTMPVRPPATSRSWVPPVVAVLEGLCLLLVLGVVGMAGTVTQSQVATSARVGEVVESPVVTSYDGSPLAGVAAIFGSLPFWLPLVLLVAMSALWTGREKTFLLALAPLGALLFGVLPSVGWALFGENGVYGAAWLTIGLLLIGGGTLVGVLVRRGLIRAQALRAA